MSDRDELTELPVEGPTKYGRDQFDDIDPTELAHFLTRSRANSSDSAGVQNESEVDDDAGAQAGHPGGLPPGW